MENIPYIAYMESIGPLALLALLALVLAFCVFSLILGILIGFRQGRAREDAEWRAGKLEGLVKTRLKQSRAVLGGLVSEQLAPLLPGFPYDPGDCRFVGKPVDFIVFRGMNRKEISEIIFLEVKSGSARALSDQEKKVRNAVLAGRVRWAQFDL
jgi:predicted Holliday junction resolvase-like endonuclease